MLLAAALSTAVLAGCSGGNESGMTEIDVLWDNLAFIIGDDIDEAIASDEQSIAENLFDDIPRAQATLDNTKIMREYAEARNIKLSSANMGWNDGLTTALLSCFWMQDGPDIIQGEEQLPQFIEDGYIAPLPDDMAERIREKCSPVAYKALERDGKLYGVAIQPGVTLLFWNKDVLRAAGYSDSDPIMTEGPKDWDEWLEVMERVDQTTDARGGGLYVGSQMAGYLRVGALLDSNGTYYADDTGAPRIDDEASVQAFDFIRQQRQYNDNGICNSMDYFSTYNSAFARGDIAFKVDGNWCMYELEQQGIDYGCALLPPRTEGGQRGTQLIGACYMCVPAYSEHKEEAFYLLEAMLDERIQTNIAKIGFRMPVLKSVIESDEYKEANEVAYIFANYAMNNEIKSLPPFRGNVSEIWNAVGVAFSSSYSLSATLQTVRDALNDAQGKMMEYYLS